MNEKKLSVKARNILEKLGAVTDDEIINIPLNSIKNIKGCGKATYHEIENYISELLNPSIKGNVISNKIEKLDVSPRLKNCLMRMGIRTLKELENIPNETFKTTRGFGAKCYDELLELKKRLSTYEIEDDELEQQNNQNKTELLKNSSKNTISKTHSYIRIEELNLSPRLTHCLFNEDIKTTYDLLNTANEELSNIRGLGKKTLEELFELKNRLQNNELLNTSNNEIEICKLFNIENNDNWYKEPFINYSRNKNVRKPILMSLLNIYSEKNSINANELTIKQYLFANNDIFLCDNGELVDEINIQQIFPKIKTVKTLIGLNLKNVTSILNSSYLWLLSTLSKLDFEEIENCIPQKILSIEKNTKTLSQVQKKIYKTLEKDYKTAKLCNLKPQVFYNAFLQNEDIFSDYDNKENDDILLNNEFITTIYCNEILSKYSLMLFKSFIPNDKFITITELKNKMPKHYAHTDLFNKNITSLKKEKRLLVKGNKIILKKLTFNDFINSIPDQNQRIVLEKRYKGFTLEEIGKDLNVSRERIRQIEKKTILRKIPVFEDIYREAFEKYDFSREIFNYIFEESDETYNYLKLYYKKGEKELKHIFKDKNIIDDVKLRYEKYLDLNKIFINGNKVVNDKKEILKFYIKTKCQEQIKFTDFYKNYKEFIETVIKDDVYLYPERSLEGNLPVSYFTIWGQWHTFRYFNKQAIDIRSLFRDLEIESYKNSEISTKLIYDKNKDYLQNLNILDEYELHNLIKTYETEIPKYYKIKITRSPGLIFGNGNRFKQLQDLIDNNPYLNDSEICRLYEEKYGVLSQNVYINYIPAIPERRKKLSYINETVHRKDKDTLDDFKIKLNEDIYSLEFINELFCKTYKTTDKLSGYDLENLGFKFSSQLIYKNKYNSLTDYLNHLFQNDLVDMSADYNYLIQQGSVYNYVYNLQNNYQIIEYSPRKYINVNRLKLMDITKNDIIDYCSQIQDLIGVRFFTIESLKKLNFNHKLYKLGFDDYFYESILKFNPNCRSISCGLKRVFRFTTNQFNVIDFITYIIENVKSIDVYDLQSLLENEFDIHLDTTKIISVAENSDLYYSETMEKIYINYDEFYKEF